jgi:hypothetical protein
MANTYQGAICLECYTVYTRQAAALRNWTCCGVDVYPMQMTPDAFREWLAVGMCCDKGDEFEDEEV